MHVADDKPRPLFLVAVIAFVGVLVLFYAYCSGGVELPAQEARDRHLTIVFFAVIAGIIGVVLIWRVYTMKMVGEATLLIPKSRFQPDEVIEGVIELGVDQPVTEARVCILWKLRHNVQRSEPLQWSVARSNGRQAIRFRGTAGENWRRGMCFLELKAQTMGGRRISAAFMIHIDE
jgi:hypothetical protein